MHNNYSIQHTNTAALITIFTVS